MLGLSSYQKGTAALRMLAYGSAADSLDECVRMSGSTVSKTLQHFTRGIIAAYSPTYMRHPTNDDMVRILALSEKRGFPGMLGSIDCCKWVWKNCPTAWHGQYQGKEGVASVTLEAIADQSLWIWHAFFGMPGCNNDINVLEASPLLNNIANGSYPPPVEYSIMGVKRNVPYWLADGIYPKWPVFVHTVAEPLTEKEKCLTRHQEAARKDVERAFGVLQSKWNIISRPGRFWSTSFMHDVMICCIILHNMCVEDRKDDNEPHLHEQPFSRVVIGNDATPLWGEQGNTVGPGTAPVGSLSALCATSAKTKDHQGYVRTRALVMDHLWQREGCL